MRERTLALSCGVGEKLEKNMHFMTTVVKTIGQEPNMVIMLNTWGFSVKMSMQQVFPLLCYMGFLFLWSSPQGICVIILQNLLIFIVSSHTSHIQRDKLEATTFCDASFGLTGYEKKTRRVVVSPSAKISTLHLKSRQSVERGSIGCGVAG